MNALFLAALIAIMTVASPPGRKHYVPEAEETKEEALARYTEIAKAAYDVAFDPEETPILGNRKYTLAMLLAISFAESGWRKDVDTGEGRKRLSKLGWNDHGRSWCVCQIQLGKSGEDSATSTTEGWTGKELLEDRHKCFRAALHIIRKSQCGRGPGMLNAYATGSCDKGIEKSRARMALAQRFYERIKSLDLAE